MREWQEAPPAGLFNDWYWFREQPRWSELVQSALKFLSGNVLGLLNFNCCVLPSAYVKHLFSKDPRIKDTVRT